MELTQSKVTHIRYGTGTVLACDNGVIRILFPADGEKQFLYPDAFTHFLKAEDSALAAQIAEQLILKKAEEAELRREQEALRQLQQAAREAQQSAPAKKKPAAKRTAKRKG